MSSHPPPSSAPQKVRYVIEPNRSWFNFDWAELIEYRDLLFLLYRRDFVSRYKQTILGPIWYVLQPLMTALIFSFVFGRFAGISTDGVPRVLFYLAGLLGWNFFSQTLNSTSSTFATNVDLFGKVYFPRLVVPLASLLTNLLNVAVQFAIFLLFYFLYAYAGGEANYSMGAGVLLLPLLLVLIAGLGMGAGLWFSSLTILYRDLRHALGFLTTSLMFLTPVIYPLSSVPAEYKVLIQLNPMTSIIEGFRMALLGVGTVQAIGLISSIGITTIVLVSGIMAFRRTERTMIDTV